MCNFLSAIVTRQGEVLHNLNTDSHEDLIELYGLRDNNNLNNFVRVEFRPDDYKDFDNSHKYKLRVDENETPAWFEDYKEKVEAQLGKIIKTITIKGNHNILVGGVYIISSKAKIKRVVNSTIKIMLGNSTVNKMLDNSTVNEMWDNSTVNKMLGNSTVNEMLDNSTVNKMLDNSTVNEMWDNSTVNEMLGNSTVNNNKSKNKTK